MQPLFNSFPPHLSNQIQPNTTNSPSLNPLGFPANYMLANNQNAMAMQQQMGFANPQIPIPFHNSNNILPLLNMGVMPQMGFPPQNQVNNSNPNMPMFMMNQLNPTQPQAQMLSNLLQQLNPNMGFPNLQNPMQNMNSPVLPVQIPPNLSQFAAQNPNFFGNPCFGVGQPQANMNQQSFEMPKTGPTQQIQGNPSTLQQQSQNLQPSSFTGRQGNSVKNGHSGTSNSNWKNYSGKDFKKNSKREASQLGFQKSQFQHMGNGKRKFGFSNEHKGKGHGNERAAKFGRSNPTNEAREKKRSLALTYTEEEIKKWREQRRKNYPSKANIEKKQSERVTDSVVDKEAKLRREQLKEILAKQAELGVEVAEIPTHYLSDSEKKGHWKEDNRRSSNKDRFRNKHNRRGRHSKNRHVAKEQTLTDKDSSSISSIYKRKPTLLEKLLSENIKRDKRGLLQAFRFMVVNSFFKDWPEKPLKFPLVVVKEDGFEDVVGQEKSLAIGKDVSEVSNKTISETLGDAGDGSTNDNYEDEDSDDENEDDTQVEHQTCISGEKSSVVEATDGAEEEGEIID